MKLSMCSEYRFGWILLVAGVSMVGFGIAYGLTSHPPSVVGMSLRDRAVHGDRWIAFVDRGM